MDFARATITRDIFIPGPTQCGLSRSLTNRQNTQHFYKFEEGISFSQCYDNLTVFFIFNYVEFTQGKLRIARDRPTTVNDYLCCNGVKCLCPSFTHSSLTNDTCDLSDYA